MLSDIDGVNVIPVWIVDIGIGGQQIILNEKIITGFPLADASSFLPEFAGRQTVHAFDGGFDPCPGGGTKPIVFFPQ